MNAEQWKDDFDFQKEVGAEIRKGAVRNIAKAALAPKSDWTSQEVPIVGYDPPRPHLFTRTDGRHLGYGIGLHSVWGDASVGKSWLCAYFAAQEVSKGRDVWWLDFESQRTSIASRFRACGLTDQQIAGFVHYVAPENAPDIGKLCQAVAGCMVVVDSFTGLQSQVAPGTSSNDTDAVEAVYSSVLVRLQNAECTVLVIDHVTKERAGGSDAPIGSQRKRSMLDVGWNLIARDGYASLIVRKDRHANFDRGESVAALQWTNGSPMLSEHAQDAPGATQSASVTQTPQEQITGCVRVREEQVAAGQEKRQHTQRTLVQWLAKHGTPRKSETWWKEYVRGAVEAGHLVEWDAPDLARARYLRLPPAPYEGIAEGAPGLSPEQQQILDGALQELDGE